MFSSNIVFIVGAGASAEFNLPVGDDLTTIISKLVDVKFQDGYRMSTGDPRFAAAIKTYAQSSDDMRIYQEIVNACWHIRDAMPLAPSIDSFIESHASNELIQMAAKLAIARAILKSERESTLFVKTDRSHEPKINISNTSDSWLAKFIKLLTPGCDAALLGHQLSKITFICFNYDRCIEHYLSEALKKYYLLNDDQLRDVRKSIRVIHPYGLVGKLPWEPDEYTVEFGAKEGGERLLDIASQLRTYSETNIDADVLYSIHNALAQADIMVFLGFAFHPQNMDLLQPSTPLNTSYVFATALDASSSDCDAIEKQIYTLLNASKDTQQVHIRSDKTCSNMFAEYWRSFSQF